MRALSSGLCVRVCAAALAGSIGLLGTGILTPARAAVSAPKNVRKLFEVTGFGLQTLENEATPYVFRQAGGHPWGLSLTIKFASETISEGGDILEVPTQDAKNIAVTLPAGLTLNPNPRVFPRCPLRVVLAGIECPPDTQIGMVRLRLLGGITNIGPIVNVTPEKGQSAEFGFETSSKINALLTGHVVRDGSGYGLVGQSNDIPMVSILEAETTFWGVPADPSHDSLRGVFCDVPLAECLAAHADSEGTRSGLSPAPLLTMPSDCTSDAAAAKLRTDSWEDPGRYVTAPPAALPRMTGCNLLSFKPEIEIQPDTPLADSPVSLGVDLTVPQVESTTAPATPYVRDSVLTFPEGLSISPGIVDGIRACEESGPEGINFEGPLSEEVGLNGELQLAPGRCPDASIVGTARAFSPLLDEPVEGHVYLAKPGCGGAGQSSCTEEDALDGNLYQIYLELGGKGALANTGVNLKVRGKTEANPATGQLTAVFEDTPQLPFSKLEVRLNGGPRAPMDNPATCRRATTTTDFSPWSAPGFSSDGFPVAGTPDATPSAYFDVVGCGSPPPLNPGFFAGTVTPQAGQFSAFTLDLTRKDREQYIDGIEIHTPPGLLGMLSSVPLCGSAEAEAGTCSQEAKIGTTRVASGAGSHPFEIEGDVYLTGPYGGAPFGLSIVTHVVAGPFNLGVVVVRAKIYVDSSTSTLTISTDRTGPHAIPQILFGVPLRLQRVTATIDRPGFMFNPTNCSAHRVSAVISGSQSASASVATQFAVTGCKTLSFKPMFTASTTSRTSRAKGASLDVKLSYPRNSVGKAANIARVKVSLPKRLPSRLTTLQKACPASTFESNPAACPAASIVGTVRATTPLLAKPLRGPVYFVSHGGEAFPSLIVVLEGEGVRVDLIGTTFIDKAGITSSTFKTVPDVPASTFELYLPQGKGSALAATGNLCQGQGKLVMPTEMVAQNGAVMRQSTRIRVSGCPKKATKSKRAKRASLGYYHRVAQGRVYR